MRRRLVLVALFVIAALIATASPALAVKVKIPDAGRSHHHPRGKDFSWLAIRFEGSPGAKVEITVTGGAVDGERTYKGTIPDSGKMTAVWKITQATEYEAKVTATKGNQTDKDDSRYTVPYPKPRWGNFHFPRKADLHNGWPTE